MKQIINLIIENIKLKIISSFSKGLSITEYKNINPITEKNIVSKKFKWLSFLKFFFTLGSSENIVAHIPINMKIDIIR